MKPLSDAYARRLRRQLAAAYRTRDDREGGANDHERTAAQSRITHIEARLVDAGLPRTLPERPESSTRKDRRSKRVKVEVAEVDISVTVPKAKRTPGSGHWYDPRGQRQTPPDPLPSEWRRCAALVTLNGEVHTCNRLFDPRVDPESGKPVHAGTEREFCSYWCRDRNRRTKERALRENGDPSTYINAELGNAFTKRDVLTALAGGKQGVMMSLHHWMMLISNPANVDVVGLPITWVGLDEVIDNLSRRGEVPNLTGIEQHLSDNPTYQQRRRMLAVIAAANLAEFVPEYGSDTLALGEGRGKPLASMDADLPAIHRQIVGSNVGEEVHGIVIAHRDISTENNQ